MISVNDLQNTLADVVDILKLGGWKFHLTGGLATSYYGEPRFTQDIDIVIRLKVSDPVDLLVHSLAKKFIIDEQTVPAAIRDQKIFQALHEATMIKIDFHVGEAIPGELERSIVQELLPGIQAPLVSKEDAILSKLLWIKKGSAKSEHDVLSMMMRGSALEEEYLAAKIESLGLQAVYEAIVSRMPSRNDLES